MHSIKREAKFSLDTHKGRYEKVFPYGKWGARESFEFILRILRVFLKFVVKSRVEANYTWECMYTKLYCNMRVWI